ncbi:MAG: hypothetical protein MJ094_00155 [Saccharofermentans sp.]|nr:hypothetical protein [Saccharofermentans sp.]
MRRDYFTCVFLLCICISLFYVCFLPLYFVYGGTVPRTFSWIEMLSSWIFLLLVFVVLPAYAAKKKKFWITAGLAAYGILASIPVWIMPSLVDKLAGEDASIIAVAEAYVLRFIYGMAEAPFAAITPVFGDSFAEALPRRIMPVVLIIHCGTQIFRFYRKAYIAEQRDPLKELDTTSRENSGKIAGAVNNVRQPVMQEVIGTVISAPERPQAPVRIPANPGATNSDRP